MSGLLVNVNGSFCYKQRACQMYVIIIISFFVYGLSKYAITLFLYKYTLSVDLSFFGYFVSSKVRLEFECPSAYLVVKKEKLSKIYKESGNKIELIMSKQKNHCKTWLHPEFAEFDGLYNFHFRWPIMVVVKMQLFLNTKVSPEKECHREN